MESVAQQKSTNNSMAARLINGTPSTIRWIVRIYDVVDQFLRKQFWFFQIFFSIKKFNLCGVLPVMEGLGKYI